MNIHNSTSYSLQNSFQSWFPSHPRLTIVALCSSDLLVDTKLLIVYLGDHRKNGQQWSSACMQLHGECLLQKDRGSTLHDHHDQHVH